MEGPHQYYRRMVPRTHGGQCTQQRRCSLRDGLPSRANPARAGDAKPGIFPREDRPVAGFHRTCSVIEVNLVKAILARFTLAVSLLATMALTLGAGVKWDWWS
jgi:hypothetical protein